MDLRQSARDRDYYIIGFIFMGFVDSKENIK